MNYEYLSCSAEACLVVSVVSLTLEKNSDKYPLSLQDALGEEI